MQTALGPVFNTVSPQAGAIANLFGIVLVICGVIFAIVTSAIAYNLLRFRAKADAPEPRQIFGNRRLEILWTATPAAILALLLFLTSRVMGRVDPPLDAKADIIVTGHQWWWEARYVASGVHAANEIHIPAGKRWLVDLEAADVIHDLWSPQLGRKMDAVPGRTNRVWLEADIPGTYIGFCDEFCGAQHAWMQFRVIAQPPAEFEAWAQQQTQPAIATAATAAGRKAFQDLLCVNCHAVGGIGTNATAGPDLTHVAGRETLGGGVLANSPANLALWLKNPQAIKPACLMPNFNLTDGQARDLAAFLEATP